MKANIATIRFRECGKLYNADASNLTLKWHDGVLVEYDSCMQAGIVVTPPSEKEIETVEIRILRKLTHDDMKTIKDNTILEKEAYLFCKERISARELNMKLIKVYAYFDRKKIMFYYSAKHRIDFRELVKDLARRFRTRIEMRQIGIRDETKIIGGLGYCGRELCCTSVISRFEPVPVRAAREQNLSINPIKISGLCGRLMCCIGYESAIYRDLLKKFPQIGEHVSTPEGPGEVVAISIFRNLVGVRLKEGGQVFLDLARVTVEKRKDDEQGLEL